MRVIFDAEFDSLTPTKVWCVVCKDIDTGKNYVFRYDKDVGWRGLQKFARSVSLWVGLNSVVFDMPNLDYLIGGIRGGSNLDLLIVSRLVWYKRPKGHSVAAWAERFGMLKPEIKVYDDPKMIEDYVKRCVEDVEIQHRIYLELLRFIDDPEWHPAIELEHKMQLVCIDMHENGFGFDIDKAKEYLDVIEKEMDRVELEMLESVPYVCIQEKPITLKRNKDGKRSKTTRDIIGGDADFVTDSVFYRCHHQPFNPGSPRQRIDLLNKAGWKPFEKTKGHLQCERDIRSAERYGRNTKQLKIKLERYLIYGWKVNEDNLATLPATAPSGARLLATWLGLEGRRAFLVEWCHEYRPHSGRIHGTFTGIGAWTQRMSHSRPNEGNVFSEFHLGQCKVRDNPSPVEDIKLRFNGVLRGLWEADRDAYLLGCDAEGIQARILAHYLDDADYTHAIETGDKKLGTDIHSLNSILLGKACVSRDDAKTFYYAWVLGAGIPKIAAILGCNQRDAAHAVRLFIDGTPNLEQLKSVSIRNDAGRGYFVGLDGRKVVVPGEHYVLAGYLQNGESILMKHANLLWRGWADEEGLSYKQVNFVHDEWQTEFYNESEGHRLGVLQCDAIKKAGVDLGVRCALAGEYRIGRNWKETH